MRRAAPAGRALHAAGPCGATATRAHAAQEEEHARNGRGSVVGRPNDASRGGRLGRTGSRGMDDAAGKARYASGRLLVRLSRDITAPSPPAPPLRPPALAWLLRRRGAAPCAAAPPRCAPAPRAGTPAACLRTQQGISTQRPEAQAGASAQRAGSARVAPARCSRRIMAARPRSCERSVREAHTVACSPRPQRSTSRPVRALKYFTAAPESGFSGRGVAGKSGGTRCRGRSTRLAAKRARRRAQRRRSSAAHSRGWRPAAPTRLRGAHASAHHSM